MYKVVIADSFGPFCGMGGYGTVRGVGFSKSPLKARRMAERDLWRQGDAGGGVPILRLVTMWRNNRRISDRSE